MVKNVVKDIALVIRHEHRSANLLMFALYVVFLAASYKMGGLYPFCFMFFSMFGFMLSVVMSRNHEICDYMTPMGDGERKRYYITKNILLAAASTILFFCGSLIAMLGGKHNVMAEHIPAVILLHVIGCLWVINAGLDISISQTMQTRKTLKYRLFGGISYGSTTVYLIMILTLYRDQQDGVFLSEMNLLKDIVNEGILIVCLITISFQLLQMLFYLRENLMYEYGTMEDVESFRKRKEGRVREHDGKSKEQSADL